MIRRRFSRAVAVTTVASLVLATAAFADTTPVDGDTAVNPNNISYAADPNSNQRDCDDRGEAIPGIVSIRYNGSDHFTAGQAVTVSFTPAAGSGISVPAVNTTIPNPWTNQSADYPVNFTTTVPASLANGTYAVTVSASSATYTPNTTSYTVTVNCPVSNTAPTVNAGPATYSGNEAASISLTGSASDDGPAPLTLAWTATRLTGDASASCTFGDASAAVTTITCNDNGAWTLRLTATDGASLSSYDEAALTVNNVAPTANLANGGPGNEGSAISVTFSGAADVSSVDMTAGFTYAFSCDGTTFDPASALDSATCTFGDNGTFAVKGKVIDKDGDSTEYTTNVQVSNVPPSRTGQSFSFNPFSGVANASVSFSDPGWLDVVTADFSGIADSSPTSYGPGSSPGPLTGTFSTSQTYTGCITSAIAVQVSDDDGGSFSYEFAAADTLGRYTATFLAPLKDATRNIAKLGNVIPVKLQVLDCHGNPVDDLTLSITLASGDKTGETEFGDTVVASSVSSADTGNQMRYQTDGGFYMYNLATRGLSTGTPFTIVIKDGTQLVQTALIELKK